MELEGEARAAFVRERREEFQKDIDVFRLASEMLVDAVVPPSELRGELIKRLGYAAPSSSASRRGGTASTPSEIRAVLATTRPSTPSCGA